MKEFNMLIWLTQLGISVAVPLTACIWIAAWLRSRFELGPWVLLLGIGLGLYLAYDGFRASVKAMERMQKPRKDEQEPPPISFNDHQ